MRLLKPAAPLARLTAMLWLACALLQPQALRAQEDAPRPPGLDQKAAIRASQTVLGRSIGDYTGVNSLEFWSHALQDGTESGCRNIRPRRL